MTEKEWLNGLPACACGCGLLVAWNKQQHRWSKYRQGHFSRVQKLSPEHKAKIGKTSRDRWQNPEYKDKMSKHAMERFKDPELRQKMSKRSTEQWQDPERRQKMSKQVKERWQNPEYRKNIAEAVSNHNRERWQDPNYRDRIMRSLLLANSQTPNKPEAIIDMLTPDEVRYVGNRAWWRRIKVLVNGVYTEKNKNPDFKVKDQNKVIEIFGTYWHKDDDPEALINAYKDAGIDCLVIWEHEIYQELEKVLERIGAFLGKESWQMTLRL